MLLFLLLIYPLGDDTAKTPEVKEPALRAELLKRTKIDQDARFALINWSKQHGDTAKRSPEDQAEYQKLLNAVIEADKDNTKWLKEIIAKHGWPTFSMVGKDGAQSAWLMVQHADLDPKFQRQSLDLMTKAPKEEVSLKNLAYLTDRVLLAEGKKQLYGTQYLRVYGKLVPRPLEDEKNCDKRRAEVGLGTLAEYEKQLSQVYDSQEKKAPVK